MKSLALLLFIVMPFSAFAEELTRCYHAIANHAREAIIHNTSVRPLYSKLSDGESDRLSSALIASEKLTTIAVAHLEHESRLYQEAGIPLLCDDLASMHDLPPFQESLPEDLRPHDFFDFDYKESSKKIRMALKEKNYDEAYTVIATDLNELSAHPNQQCMTKHILESMARSLMLRKKRQSEALNHDLPDPTHIIEKYVTLQRRVLGIAHYLDENAFPLQQKGIAIFCQDVPAITWK
jgi:hypothetical protein